MTMLLCVAEIVHLAVFMCGPNKQKNMISTQQFGLPHLGTQCTMGSEHMFGNKVLSKLFPC